MTRKRWINPTVDAFRRMPLFEGCRREELEMLGRFADEVIVPAGFALLREGELAQECFLLIDGAAEVRVGDHAVATAPPATLLGGQSMLSRTRRTASVSTTTQAHVFCFGARGFRQLLELPLVAERIFTAAGSLPECVLPAAIAAAEPRPSSAPLLAVDVA
ncbi:MAG: hypothetical protein QOJ79_389 [Actinomycetota bacterium]|jgi:CRP-like cAMP-binding protein|nr:hypothetical protein [Actinomycetota bacterium]